MLRSMQMMFDALWRALADCLRGKVIAWSLFPLALIAVMTAVLGWVWWTPAVATVQTWLEQAAWLQWLWTWLDGATALTTAIVAALLVVLAMSPVVILVALAIVGVVMTPQMVEMVAQRRYPLLERKRGGGWISSVAWALGSTAIALVALLVSIPLWLVPPLVLVLPPLIWGWLTYRVMAFDALAEHASKSERQWLLQQHKYRLLLMGVICGYAGAAPSIVWASGLVFVAAFWLLIPLAIWIYALVFAFSSLWFAHYGLAALAALRAESGSASPARAPATAVQAPTPD